MSVDTVNYALTKVRRGIELGRDLYSDSGQQKLLAMCACMRDPLLINDIPGFDNYVDSILAREPDAADFLLDELFEQLGINDRDGLTTKLLED